MNFFGAYLRSTHRTTGNKQILSRMEVEDMKASDNQRVSIRKAAGAQSVLEKAKLNGYVITALLTIMQNTGKNLLGGCAILHVTIVTA